MVTTPRLEFRRSGVATLVVRVCHLGSLAGQRGFRYQVTHIQSGEVTHFRNIECLVVLIERLKQQLIAQDQEQRM